MAEFSGIKKQSKDDYLKRLFLRPLLLSLCCAAVGGCYTPRENIKGDYNYDAAMPTGLVVGSATSPDGKLIPNFAGFYFQNADGSETGRIDVRTFNFGLYRDTESDLPNVHGHLFAIALPPGTYEIVSWQISSGNVTISPRNLSPLTFVVEPDTTKYIGDLNLDILTGKNIFGMTILAGAVANVRDEHERDLPLLKYKFPRLKHSDVKIETMDGTPWRHTGKLDRSIEMYVPPVTN